MRRIPVALALAGALAGCGTANNLLAPKTKTVEYYRIFDVRTAAPRAVVARAASDGLGRNVNGIQEATPIPASAAPPETPGRFQLVNPFAGTRLGALAAMGGNLGMRMATCEDAAWTARAERRVANSNTVAITACLFPYRQGYHLDLYAVFTQQEGGLMEISRQAAYALVGTPEQWVEKTVADTVRAIETATQASVTYLEGQPEPQDLPWHDRAAAPGGAH